MKDSLSNYTQGKLFKVNSLPNIPSQLFKKSNIFIPELIDNLILMNKKFSYKMFVDFDKKEDLDVKISGWFYCYKYEKLTFYTEDEASEYLDECYLSYNDLSTYIKVFFIVNDQREYFDLTIDEFIEINTLDDIIFLFESERFKKHLWGNLYYFKNNKLKMIKFD